MTKHQTACAAVLIGLIAVSGLAYSASWAEAADGRYTEPMAGAKNTHVPADLATLATFRRY